MGYAWLCDFDDREESKTNKNLCYSGAYIHKSREALSSKG